MILQRSDFESKLSDQRVYLVLQDLSDRAIRWTGGGSVNHRIVGMGYLAESGVRSIEDGRMGINKESTFENLRNIDEDGYRLTIDFLYNLSSFGVYSP